MCLTGVDYFSTLGYQPSIAFLAAGAVSPIATLILVLLTLFGALPIYRRVAAASPHGEGSISMLEDLLPRWRGKLFVLVLLGFVATDFIITITMSAADATEHIVKNPLMPESLHHHIVGITLALIAVLGAIFLKGFREAIGLAVGLVAVYLLLNLIVVAVGGYQVLTHPHYITDWKNAMLSLPEVHGNPLLMIGFAMLLFPKLALGLSGFETGVAVMPLVQGGPEDDYKNPAGRVRNTRRLLLTAGLIMSFFLITSSLITTMLIPAAEFRAAEGGQPAGQAFGRALAYLAHTYLGSAFGTIYDISTITILWFAGASAMAGLLNIVPRYLPRYGMAPDWTKANRPLALVFTLIAFLVTIYFKANVEAQGGAYATGVLVLMTSAAVAVTLLVWGEGKIKFLFLTIAVVFLYTTALNIYERPDGVKIASFFIVAIIVVSIVSRALRSTELRVDGVELNETARRFIEETKSGTIRIIANRQDKGDVDEYRLKEKEERWNNHIPSNDPVLFFEVRPSDASDFSGKLTIRGVQVGNYRILRTKSPAVPNAIAAFLLHVRNQTGQIPHVYFGWTEGNPLVYVLKFIFFGEGDTAPVTHEILRQAEPDRAKRPAVHVGG
ncbi:MAG TPA: amino acid transporter [Blastocatellia bacterium]|nr:amino acid transporter [Blastocatellia bacterium]HMX27133.1 amino acid transporter [Blastocatellia bacterium]HMY72505.1 amino acid transporter [Blastocatellia bacterium]HMZ22016.1 amino acid transporter [Blastocatellia bacterium]HNG32447.1 amino acid transporter [Blastocatellia bacterium]